MSQKIEMIVGPEYEMIDALMQSHGTLADGSPRLPSGLIYPPLPSKGTPIQYRNMTGNPWIDAVVTDSSERMIEVVGLWWGKGDRDKYWRIKPSDPPKLEVGDEVEVWREGVDIDGEVVKITRIKPNGESFYFRRSGNSIENYRCFHWENDKTIGWRRKPKVEQDRTYTFGVDMASGGDIDQTVVCIQLERFEELEAAEKELATLRQQLAAHPVIKCPECDGEGEIVENEYDDGPHPRPVHRTCPICKGKKYLQVRHAPASELPRGYSAQKCPDCDGDGFFFPTNGGKKIACETCGGHEDSAGRGWIDILDQEEVDRLRAAMEKLEASPELPKEGDDVDILDDDGQWIGGYSCSFVNDRKRMLGLSLHGAPPWIVSFEYIKHLWRPAKEAK